MDTKGLLAEALHVMMQEKSLDKITISDLTNYVGINRQTFYYHFHDIFELVEYVYREGTLNAIGDMKTIDTWQTGLLRLFNATLQSRDFVEQTFRSVTRERAEDFLYEIMNDLIINAINETSASLMLVESDKQLIADFYKHALIGMLLEWIKSGMEENPEILVHKIEIIARDGFIGAVSTFVSTKMDITENVEEQ